MIRRLWPAINRDAVSGLWPKTRKSHPLSKLLRPVFEDKRLRETCGVFLIAFVFLSGLLTSRASAFETYQKGELVALEAEVKVNTEKGIKPPLGDFYLSQGYWFLHPAVDLVTGWGTPVFSVMAGKVEKAEFGHFGYGNNVIIDHGHQLKSRYAHLAKIEVKEGEKVTQETIIGRVGSTGWATGAHLHLEIKKESQYLNPKVFLP